MRQLLGNSQGVVIARMPRPAVVAGSVLVRVHYSLISIGTETAAFRSSGSPSDASAAGSVRTYRSLARKYLRLALQDPRKAVTRLLQKSTEVIRALATPAFVQPAMTSEHGDLRWTSCAASRCEVTKEGVEIVTDESELLYQVKSQAIEVPAGSAPIVRLRGQVREGMIAIGLLNETQDRWLAVQTFGEGLFEDDSLRAHAGEATAVTVVIANAGRKRPSQVLLENVQVLMVGPASTGSERNELGEQGWNLGYSAAGQVIAVGEGITDLRPGDWVACGGAGQANHADYIGVKRNLACRVPQGCSLKAASTTTVGTIALQGIRRAGPQLGEKICVLGLGLIGQITAQMLHANGCRLMGHDLSPERVARAKQFGMEWGDHDADRFKSLVRDVTQSWGADRTIITAATKSDALINLAMELTRPKGTVVIVGDVGLNVQRALFYRKEIDLLMSTSYGPGRYDPLYEEKGNDYPYPYVRWTLNRNMQTYMEMVSSGRLNIEGLIDRVIKLEEAPSTYKMLSEGNGDLPLGVLLRYENELESLPETVPPPSIVIRGHRKASEGPIKYALVGAGAFGTGMLVPQMNKHPRLFFLRGVVSRDTTRGGNFARANRVEVLATELQAVLEDQDIALIVIATRHYEHAEQVVASIRAEKHVFVEKPLALSWQELEEVDAAYRQTRHHSSVMVGFNRRFSPACQKLAQVLAGRRSPLMMNYRLNAGYIPLESWVQRAEGGGRNVGEACHAYDVFRFLTKAQATAISAISIDPGALPYMRNDNFCATVQYQDGSVCNLMYTALGPKQGLPKERIEVFCDGEAYLVDDFRRLVQCRDEAVLWQSEEVDKGHAEELRRFGEALVNGLEAPIPFEEIVETTALALHIEDLLHGRISDEN